MYLFELFFSISLIALTAVTGFYLSYFLILKSCRKRVELTRKENNPKTWKMASETPSDVPFVSIIVPVYNEEKIISQKIDNLKLITYPGKMEVIFVDGHSKDNTCAVIEKRLQGLKTPMRIIAQKERDGYTGAVIEGIRNSQGEIIIATDAASYYLPDAVQCLVRHFINPTVGAVTGQEIVLGDSKTVGPKLEKTYRSFYDFMRQAETEIDSTPDSKGELLAVRKNICLELIPKLSLSPNASFDSCIPYQAKLMGYRTVYDEYAKYYEIVPASASDRFTQQARRATILIGALLLFKNMVFRKRFNKFGYLILPMHFLMDCVMPRHICDRAVFFNCVHFF